MSRISIKFDQAVIKKNKNKKKNSRRKNEGKDSPGKMKEKCLFASTFYLVDLEKSGFWELLKTENIGQLLLSDQGNRRLAAEMSEMSCVIRLEWG